MGKKKVSAELIGRKRGAESVAKPSRKARKSETPEGDSGVSGPSSRVSGRDRGGAPKVSPRPRGVQLLFEGLGFDDAPPLVVLRRSSDAEGGGTGGGPKKTAPKGLPPEWALVLDSALAHASREWAPWSFLDAVRHVEEALRDAGKRPLAAGVARWRRAVRGRLLGELDRLESQGSGAFAGPARKRATTSSEALKV